MSLVGKIAVIVGASGGIGEAIAQAFAKQKAQVILVGKSPQKLERVLKKIRAIDQQSYSYVVDIRNTAEIHQAVETIVKNQGRIDFLINCAGIFEQVATIDQSLDSWHEIIETNLTGVFAFCQSVLPVMLKQKQGMIFNFSSIGGKIGLAEKAAYCASKFGVVGFSRALAKEVMPYGIKVHIVFPHLVDSQHEVDWDNVGENENAILNVQDVAEYLVFIANRPQRVYIEDIDIKPFLQ